MNVIDLLTELGFTSLVFHRVQVARNIHECHNFFIIGEQNFLSKKNATLGILHFATAHLRTLDKIDYFV